MNFFTKLSYRQKALLISFFYYAVSGLGMSLSIKADIGVTCFNALILSMSDIFNMKVGTLTTISNLSFLLVCFILDKERSISRYLLMLVANLCFGYVVNFFYYSLLGPVTLNNYFMKVICFFIGLVVTCFAVGRILYYNTLKFPIENFCTLVSERTNHSMKFYRYCVDVVGFSGSLLLSFLFNLPIYVREGTVISLFLFSYIMSWSYERKGISK
ncbi:YczE/YyaS/YitT family protein [Floricoccus penangensis]|uniref:YczE/YyaS/YitT family protein n=1 Tax=Floricoccus penangensis TaxID=1859475 RepID=UPI001E46608E|nr:hypothetical protein [Floricoccus penangensis]